VQEYRVWLLNSFVLVCIILVVFSFFSLLNKIGYSSISDDNAEIQFSYAYFVSEDDTHTAQNLIKSNVFTDNSETPIPIRLGNHSYWHKFQVKNISASSQELTMFFDNYVIAEIDVYTVSGGSTEIAKRMGNGR